MKRVVAVVMALGLAVGIAACTPESTAPGAPGGPVALTGAQAERLAVARFRNFDAGTREISAELASSAGVIALTGWFDYENVTGYASVTVGDASAGLVWWTHDVIATREVAVDSAVTPIPEDGWMSGPLVPSSTPLANALALAAGLGADRPENPQLLAQSDAAWLRSDEIDGTAVDVFLGPSSESATAAPVAASERARYWVDASGLLLRFEFPQATNGDPLVIDFGDAVSVRLPSENPGTP
jgi:hypothetical protein